ncbi:MAG: carbohydrate ABC transporter permease [Armatimonadetes bacterium]|nr:carbohydrate ABC transporter permease [Armatimonadota bacterium]
MKHAKTALSYTLMIALAVFLMAPFVWMVLVSLHESRTAIPTLDNLIPAKFHWENYTTVLIRSEIPVGRFFFNSMFVSTCVVLGQLLVCSLAAYAFARLRFKGRDAIFIAFLLSMMFAGPVTQIPVYLMLRNFGWLDTYLALIVPGVSSAFAIFLLRQFFIQIPIELDEAARLDGAGEFKIYWRLIMPMSKAALATAGVFTFIGVWTDFFWPLLATDSLHMRTLEVGLSIFKNSYGATNWPLQMTAAVIVMLPILVVFVVLQRYFVKGITMGSIK